MKGREIDDVLINLTVLGRRGALRSASSTFDVKKAEKSSGVRDVGLFSLPRPRTAFAHK